MRINLVSDLHEEHWRQLGVSAIDLIPVNESDVLVIAGDLLQASFFERGGQLEERLAVLRGKAKHVVYVMGNHEAYDRHFLVVRGSFRDVFRDSGIHFLDDRALVIDGVRFVGSTLWYDPSTENATKLFSSWSDGCVSGLREELPKLHSGGVHFLRDNVQRGDVVVTHMLPSELSVAKKFKGDPINCFFVTSCDDLIKDREPRLWLHGHTHVACDYMVGKTRVVCSPLGYPKEMPVTVQKQPLRKRLSCFLDI